MENKRYYVMLAIYTVLISVIHFLKIGGKEYFGIASNIFIVITPMITLVSCFYALKYFGLSSNQGKSIFLIGAGIASWAFADVLWMTIFRDAITSFADLFYFSGYALLGTGICVGIYTVNPNFLRSKKILLMLLIGIGMSIFYFRFFPIIWKPDISLLENLTTAGYVIADLLLLLCVLYLMILIFSGTCSHPWILFAIGAFICWFGDIYYAINYESYRSGDLIDLAWYFNYLLIAASFILLRQNAEKTMQINKKKRR